MTAWTSDELNKIGKAEELQIASFRKDDTLRKWVVIWVVQVGDNLYIRSVNGREGAWFRGVQGRHEGYIRAGGVEKEVTFVDEIASDLNDQIDAAYRAKYQRYGERIVGSIVNAKARAATIKLVPHCHHS